MLLLAALCWVPWALATVFNLDRIWQVPSAVAFLPYALAGTLAVAVLAVIARAWPAAAVALLGLLVLSVPRAERAIADEQPAARGERIVVATSNVYVGEGDLEALAEVVRRRRVDLLAVQENTPGSDRRLRALLSDQLPAQLSVPDQRPGAAGLALLASGAVARENDLTVAQRALGGTVTTPGGHALTAYSVHPPPPFSAGNLPGWKRYQRAYAQLLGDGSGAAQRPVLLLGDFNATLDHHPLRGILNSGFRDAAEQTGEAWRSTWAQGPKRLTIDHILVGPGVAVERVTVHPLARTDHHVVVAELRLPAA